MEHVVPALLQVLSPASIAAILIGTVFGTIVGALPGLGSVVAITVILPFTFGMPIVPSVALILAVYCSSIYGGSISAILINTPGTPQAAATNLDGYPMAMEGKASLALGWATAASVFGGVFSTGVLIVAAPQLAAVALKFGPVETFALIALALTCIAGVSRGSTLKGFAAGILGLFLATVGADPMTGDLRFEFGYFPLTAGVGLLPVLIGLFAISEVMVRVFRPHQATPQIVGTVGFKLAPLREWLIRWKSLVKGSVIGSFVGVLPGTGAAVAAFISYAEAKRAGRFRDKLGKGEPEGIVAAESANNAVSGGALVPTLALGIPGDAVTAIMMSALIIQGVQPGVRMFAENPDVIYAAFIVLILANLAIFTVGALGVRYFLYALRMPVPLLLSVVIVLSFLGAYGDRGNEFDLLVAFIAGVVGFFLRINGFPTAPVVIGLVLGRIFEESLRQGLILTDNSFQGFFVGHPIAVALFCVTFAILFLPPLIGSVRRWKGR